MEISLTASQRFSRVLTSSWNWDGSGACPHDDGAAAYTDTATTVGPSASDRQEVHAPRGSGEIQAACAERDFADFDAGTRSASVTLPGHPQTLTEFSVPAVLVMLNPGGSAGHGNAADALDQKKSCRIVLRFDGHASSCLSGILLQQFTAF